MTRVLVIGSLVFYLAGVATLGWMIPRFLERCAVTLWRKARS